MSASTYQVIFTGSLRDGFSRREGISQLAKRLSLDFDQIKKLLTYSRPVVKCCKQMIEGERLVQAFWQAGWRSELICDGHLLFDGEQHFPGVGGPAADETEKQRLFCEEARCSIEVPAGWQALTDLNGSAVMQSGNLRENQFLVVLSQNLLDLPAASTIGAYCGAQLKQCAAKLQDSEILIPATPLEEGDFPACFGEISAYIDGLPVQYLVVCIECDERIYTLFLWCEARDFGRCRKDFDRIVLSFRSEFLAAPANEAGHRVARHGTLSMA
ncbi:hypothetical protein [Microbulbifer pacificus]|uniref:hypothetical protein n=1 Tax=Microbulbifer pacificus TaxID=407164 RepID=UPI000CF48553|nr:hypothetical protein [Microbulbifer pacificus]